MDVNQLTHHWLSGLVSKDSAAFAAQYAEDGVYADPAFGLARRGRQFVAFHHKKWHAAVPDFNAVMERVIVDGRTTVAMYDCTGTFNGEPLGAGATQLKPTMRSFKARAVMIIDFDDSGLIRLSTEYYDREIMPGGALPPYSEDPRGLQ